MSYSSGISPWDGSLTTASNQVGWMGLLWTALSDTTTEPHPHNAAWQLDTPVQFTGFGITEIPNPKDYLHVRFTGLGLTEEHVNRPPEVKFFGFGLTEEPPAIPTSNLLGVSIGIAPEKEDFYPNEVSQLTGFELGLNGDSENLFPDASNLKGFCLGLGESVPFLSHCSRIYKE